MDQFQRFLATIFLGGTPDLGLIAAVRSHPRSNNTLHSSSVGRPLACATFPAAAPKGRAPPSLPPAVNPTSVARARPHPLIQVLVMSGVATLKARGVKRPLEEMAIDNPSSCSPARFALRPAPSSFKRTRFSPPPAAARSPTRLPLPGPPGRATQSDLAGLSKEELAALERHVPKRLKRVVARVANGQVGPGERLFTVADLREIVTSVVAEREAKLGEDFAKVLHEKLSEQFRDFSRFNEDYIARDMRSRDSRDCSYLS